MSFKILIDTPNYLFSEFSKSAIYGILNLRNGKIYIGSAVKANMRLNFHRHKLVKNSHDNVHLQRAWNNDGAITFDFIVLEYVGNKNNLLAREQYWINLTDSSDPEFGYNIRKIARSNLGLKYPIEAGEKVRQANLGRRHTAEHRAKNSASRMGHDVSLETRLKLKIANGNSAKWPHGNNRCKCGECKDKRNLELFLRRANHEGAYDLSCPN